MERTREVEKTEYIDLLCDNCGGEMIRHNDTVVRDFMLFGDPLYTYKCKTCDSTTQSQTQYPFQKITFKT
jgi:transposase-like protein